MNELSDKELIEIFRNGNKNYAFNLLVRKYQQKVYWHIRRLVLNHDDANDLTQETFIKTWSHLSKFREDAQLYTWIYRIATNHTLSFLSSKRKKFFIPLVDIEEKLINNLQTDAYFTGDEIEFKFQKALLSLPEKQRIVFHLRYYDEMPYEDMAKVLDTSVGALKASYHHASKKIENIMNNN